jgi:hypothetical protein
MPYLGNAPAEAYSQISYQDLTGGSGTSFTLDYPAGSAGEIEVFVNNVRQEPTVAYTVSGTSLTMTGSIAATDDFYVVFQGKAQQTIGIPEKQTDGTYVFGDSVTIDADGATVLTVDRASSDGTIIDVQKDGTSVGSIGTNSSRTYIGSGSGQSGLKFNTGAIVPVSGADGANNDAAYNLGVSTARFTNLYLSGGVYLGGTGSANLLDDYEEGTWTPTYTSNSTNPTFTPNLQDGRYTKIGRTVIASFRLRGAVTGTKVGSLRISGLPFTSAGDSAGSGGSIRLTENFGTTSYPASIAVGNNTTEIIPTTYDSSDPRAGLFTGILVSSTSASASGNYILGQVVYDI